MAKNCNPASWGGTFNYTEQQRGPVRYEFAWGWNGVSVYPNCEGPLTNGLPGGFACRVRNPGTETWYVNLPGKKSGNKWIAIPPGTDQSFTAAQLSTQGLTNYSDLLNIQLSATPG